MYIKYRGQRMRAEDFFKNVFAKLPDEKLIKYAKILYPKLDEEGRKIMLEILNQRLGIKSIEELPQINDKLKQIVLETYRLYPSFDTMRDLVIPNFEMMNPTRNISDGDLSVLLECANCSDDQLEYRIKEAFSRTWEYSTILGNKLDERLLPSSDINEFFKEILPELVFSGMVIRILDDSFHVLAMDLIGRVKDYSEDVNQRDIPMKSLDFLFQIAKRYYPLSTPEPSKFLVPSRTHIYEHIVSDSLVRYLIDKYIFEFPTIIVPIENKFEAYKKLSRTSKLMVKYIEKQLAKRGIILPLYNKISEAIDGIVDSFLKIINNPEDVEKRFMSYADLYDKLYEVIHYEDFNAYLFLLLPHFIKSLRLPEAIREATKLNRENLKDLLWASLLDILDGGPVDKYIDTSPNVVSLLTKKYDERIFLVVAPSSSMISSVIAILLRYKREATLKNIYDMIKTHLRLLYNIPLKFVKKLLNSFYEKYYHFLSRFNIKKRYSGREFTIEMREKNGDTAIYISVSFRQPENIDSINPKYVLKINGSVYRGTEHDFEVVKEIVEVLKNLLSLPATYGLSRIKTKETNNDKKKSITITATIPLSNFEEYALKHNIKPFLRLVLAEDEYMLAQRIYQAYNSIINIIANTSYEEKLPPGFADAFFILYLPIALESAVFNYPFFKLNPTEYIIDNIIFTTILFPLKNLDTDISDRYVNMKYVQKYYDEIRTIQQMIRKLRNRIEKREAPGESYKIYKILQGETSTK